MANQPPVDGSLQLDFVQKRTDDRFFPFHKLIAKVLDRDCMEPIPLLLRRYFFKERPDAAALVLSTGYVGPPAFPPALQNSITHFAEITRADVSFFCGWTEAVPDGMILEPIEHIAATYRQPPLHRLRYTHQTFPAYDIHHLCQANQEDDPLQPNLFPTHFQQTEANGRNLVYSATEQFLISKGHPEDYISRTDFGHNCYNQTSCARLDSVEIALRESFQHSICDTNENINAHFSNLNLNERTQDGDIPMEHSAIFTNSIAHRPEILQHINSLIEDRGWGHHCDVEPEDNQLSDVEFGVCLVSGSLERTLNDQQRLTMEHTPHSFLRNSPKFRQMERDFLSEGILAPPLGNPSQNWQ